MTITIKDPILLEGIALLARRVPRAYVVGGCVRDAILGNETKDADIEVYGLEADVLEKAIHDVYRGRVNAVGRSFGVFKVCLPEGRGLDISIPRRDSKAGKGHADFMVEGDPSMTIQEAVRRRDFTINALLADPLTGEVIDAVGGLKDIEQRRLRVINPERFQDDPLRVYRAIQLVGRFCLNVEPETRILLKNMVARGDMEELSKERVTEELKKLLVQSERPSHGFELARSLGIVERSMPEMGALIGIEQEPEWHPEGDVWTHTLMVVDEAARLRSAYAFSKEERLQLLIGALCHDFGKPTTTQVIDGRIRSRGHEEAGVEPARRFCSRFSFGQAVTRAAEVAAAEHLKPRSLWSDVQKGRLSEEAYVNAIRRLLKRIQPLSWRVLLGVAEADLRGRGLPEASTMPDEAGELFAKTVVHHGLEEALKTLVGGVDLLEVGVPPGERIGEIIRRVEEARDRGEVKTKEEAMGWVKRHLDGGTA